MAKVKRKFGSIEPLDREKMKLWMAEPGVHEVEVWKVDNLEFMQRVGLVNGNLFGVKKRFQKVPRNKKPLTGEDVVKAIEEIVKK